MAIQYKIPYITSMAAAQASVEGIEEAKKKSLPPKSIQEYHKERDAFEKSKAGCCCAK